MVRKPASSTAGRADAYLPEVIDLDGASYYVHPAKTDWVRGNRLGHSTILPVTVISSRNGQISANDVSKAIGTFSEYDDVWSPRFLETIVIQTPDGVRVTDSTDLGMNGTFGYDIKSTLIYTTVTPSKTLLPSGPYFIHENGIYQTWLLYPDHLDAFEITFKPQGIILEDCPEDTASAPSEESHARFAVLPHIGQNGIWRRVAVPSRLYTKPSSKRPLAGARISVKDNFKLAGIKTTMNNRGFIELYGVDEETSIYVNKLVSLGAVIVGKTSMCSFAAGEEPTDQWIDFHCPFNPRGDTYQSPGSSSSGAAASLAGYSWLDYSIGTDTAGSIRAPAACNGLYGLRPSFGSASMDGIYELAQRFDTVGVLARDLFSIHRLVKYTMDVHKHSKWPKQILCPTEFFPTQNLAQQALLDNYVSVLENYLGVKRTMFSFVERWAEHPPGPAMGKSLEEYLGESTKSCYYYDAYHAYDTFREKYRSTYNKEAYVGPVVQFRWNIGANITREQRDEAESELATFRAWFDANVLKHDRESLSDAILVLPSGKATPDYRDEPNGEPRVLRILDENTIAMVLEIPHLVLPIGQIPYQSRVSGRVEYRPISASLIGAKGSDDMLIGLAHEAFQSAGWPTKLQTGRYTFPLASSVL